MDRRIMHLVVDSGAFIRNYPIHEYAENVYTVDSAVKEIRDSATRQRLQVLPYELKIVEPETENYKHVVEFTKKTGDYASLSATDLKIIALTYQLEKLHVGADHLSNEPQCNVSSYGAGQKLEGFYCPKDDESKVHDTEDDTKISEPDKQESEPLGKVDDNDEAETQLLDNEETVPEEDEVTNSNEDDDESWITPSNLAQVQKKMGNLTLDSNTKLDVACVTTDFAIQNALIQMGLHVISVDGILIKKARTTILRCFSCYKITNEVTKKFCPNCGNNTLKRVTVFVNDDGTKNVHINFKRPINTRGTKYSLPKPQGGKHAINPILCEDQPIPHNRPPKSALVNMDIFSPDYVAYNSPFAIHDVNSRAAGLGIRNKPRGRGRKNPNDWSVRTGNKK